MTKTVPASARGRPGNDLCPAAFFERRRGTQRRPGSLKEPGGSGGTVLRLLNIRYLGLRHSRPVSPVPCLPPLKPGVFPKAGERHSTLESLIDQNPRSGTLRTRSPDTLGDQKRCEAVSSTPQERKRARPKVGRSQTEKSVQYRQLRVHVRQHARRWRFVRE